MESYENLLLAQQFYNMGLKDLENENYNDAISFFTKAIDLLKNVIILVFILAVLMHIKG